jgi:2-oxo-3-hexenedioate decarboxylase
VGTVDVEVAAATIWTARRAGQLLDPEVVLGSITIDEAYAVQGALTQRRLAEGERVVGWKLGYTSRAMREQMGVDEPNFGPLTDAMLLGDGAVVGDGLVQPRVEPEIALRLGRPLSAVDGSVERDAVLDAVAEAVASLEIVHSSWWDYRFTLEHNTADGSSAAQVVLGGVLDADDLAAVEVELTVDGVTAGRGCGADAGGHPADGVVWLLDKLAPAGVGLRAGDVVITGGLTRAVPLAPGGTASARYSHGGLRQPVTIAVQRRGQG